MKIYIRTLWSDDQKSLWRSEKQRDALRLYLNDHGFYVLTGASDSLDVYAIDYTDPWDICLIKKSLDKIQKSWYTLTRKKKEGIK
jgi:hypothetical protein